MNKDNLGARIKHNYEEVSKTRLLRRTPVFIRLDGKAFHTFTRGLKKPFDDLLVKTMQDTMLYLCRNIQGCVLGYTQSDEITLVLIDYKKLGSEAWFDYEVQKMCSITASMATLAFNRTFERNYSDLFWGKMTESAETLQIVNEETDDYLNALKKCKETGALFDARCFNVPREEVTNALLWRQLDAMRNSIQMVGQANFSSKQLHNKSCKDIEEMLKEKGIIWSDLPIHLQRGSACKKSKDFNDWLIDINIPKFTGDGREYVESLIKEEKENG